MGALAHAPWPSRLGLVLPAAPKALLRYGCGVAGLRFSSWSWRCLTCGCGGSCPTAFALGSLRVAGQCKRFSPCPLSPCLASRSISVQACSQRISGHRHLPSLLVASRSISVRACSQRISGLIHLLSLLIASRSFSVRACSQRISGLRLLSYLLVASRSISVRACSQRISGLRHLFFLRRFVITSSLPLFSESLIKTT